MGGLWGAYGRMRRTRLHRWPGWGAPVGILPWGFPEPGPEASRRAARGPGLSLAPHMHLGARARPVESGLVLPKVRARMLRAAEDPLLLWGPTAPWPLQHRPFLGLRGPCGAGEGLCSPSSPSSPRFPKRKRRKEANRTRVRIYNQKTRKAIEQSYD